MSKLSFVVHEKWIDGIPVLTARGDLDMLTSSELAEAISAALINEPAALIIDLTNVTFLASAGMALLMATQNDLGEERQLAIVASGSVTKRPMALVGLDLVLKLHPTLDGALSMFGQSSAPEPAGTGDRTNPAAHDQRIISAMSRLATDVPASLGDGLAGVTSTAVDLIAGADYAGVLVITAEGYQSLAPTASVVEELDAIQHRINDGPCVQAAVADAMVRCSDFRDDSRWPELAAAATAAGVFSMLSFQLCIRHGGTGSLTLLGRSPHAFTPEDEAIGALLASHAAIALAVNTSQHQFNLALASRDQIGQAKGIIMERFQIDAGQAFDMLKRLSQDGNTPVRDLAKKLIGTLPVGHSVDREQAAHRDSA
jgi:anti-anti-sigma factor